jgi:hypothetical protein
MKAKDVQVFVRACIAGVVVSHGHKVLAELRIVLCAEATGADDPEDKREKQGFHNKKTTLGGAVNCTTSCFSLFYRPSVFYRSVVFSVVGVFGKRRFGFFRFFGFVFFFRGGDAGMTVVDGGELVDEGVERIGNLLQRSQRPAFAFGVGGVGANEVEGVEDTKLNNPNIKLLLLTKQLRKGELYDFDYDNQIIEHEKTLKKGSAKKQNDD